MAKPQHYGLRAAPAIRWFLDTEPEVRATVAAFIRGEHPATLAVAGPPSPEDAHRIRMERARGNRDPLPSDIRLPVVNLAFRIVEHDGMPGVEVGCSEADLGLLTAWQREAFMLRAVRAREHARRELIGASALRN